MRIIQNLNPIPLQRRILPSFSALLGALLTSAGLIAGAPVLLIVILMALALLKGSFPSNFGGDGGIFFFVCAVVSAMCLYFGRRLVRGKRRLVLFLRRFGFQSASKALTFAVSSAFGRRWRLVTLDDAEIASVGVSGGKRRMTQMGRWLFLIILLVAVLYVVSWFVGDEPGRIVKNIFDNIFNSARERGDNAFAAIIGAFLGTLVVGIVVLSMALTIMLLGVSLAASATLFSWNTWREVRKAEGSKALVLTDKNQINSTLAQVAQRAKRIFAPRLTVLRVSGTFWQQVVHNLAMSADAIVVDISEPSENLLWEIETLKGIQRVRCLYVGQIDRVDRLIHPEKSHQQLKDIDLHLKTLLEDQEVLVYKSAPKGAMRNFAADLSAYLESPASV
jgi:hypothetical protein